MNKIITLTLNPAIDKTAQTNSFVTGGLNRLKNVISDAGGKGINVSKMIAALGGDSLAMGFLGGDSGAEIAQILKNLEIKTDFVKIKETTRTNLKILSTAHGITEFNEPGATVTAYELKILKKKLLNYADSNTIFVFSGSLPPGIDTDIYTNLIHMVKKKGASVFFDADGQSFRNALEAKPDYIKPNKFEFMQYFRKEDELELSLKECTCLCRQLIDKGIKMIALSMGADGALFVTAKDTFYSPGLNINALSTVGAGDSMVGALVYAFSKGMNLREAAALAMAASAGTITTQGTKPPSIQLVNKLLKNVKFI
ncbi:MAG: 1-phosphofructokinase [Defluviitaleaceae bacterium]|nr:1-phosphofructokinase [Defluviitaleaceae bacterium]